MRREEGNTMGSRKTRRHEPEIEEILNDPELLDEWARRVVKGWERIGSGYSESLKASKVA
jgi:hypothetical protein